MSSEPNAPESLLAVSRVSTDLRAELRGINDEIPIDEGGGSSLTKMLALAGLIVAHGVRRPVEIGVYRGRVLLALGATMRALGRGQAVGIDPYTVEAAIQRDDHKTGTDLRTWPSQIDWEGLHRDVLREVHQRDLGEYCLLKRKTSADAASDFATGSIDLLHLDGNHDRDAVARDIALYLPKMRAGGLLVMDDVSWPSIRPLFEDLAAEHELLLHLYDPGTFSWDDFAVLRLVRNVDQWSPRSGT